MSEKIRGLGHVKIGGKNRPFQVNGIRQANAFCEVMNIELDEYWQKMSEISTNGVLSNQMLTIAFIYSALFAGAKKERLAVDFDYEDVVDWFEDADEADALELVKPIELWVELVTKATKEAEYQEPKKA